MADITLKSKLWTDPRLYKLQERVGRLNAIGALVELWRVTLENEKMRGVLTAPLFNSLPHSKDLLECEFVTQRQAGIYVKGAKRVFEEIVKAQTFRSLGGKRSAAARKKKYGTSVPVNAVNLRTDIEVSSKSARSQLDKTKDASGNKTQRALAVYATAYQQKYKAKAIITPPDAGYLQKMTKNIPEEQLCEMMQVYLQMSDSWFIKKSHDLKTFVNSLAKISKALQTGIDPDRKEDPFSFFEERRNNKSMEVL
jgi:hypothetical protein